MQDTNTDTENVRVKKCWIDISQPKPIVWIHLYHNNTQLYWDDSLGYESQFEELYGTDIRYDRNNMVVSVRTVENGVRNPPATPGSTMKYSMYIYSYENNRYEFDENSEPDIT